MTKPDRALRLAVLIDAENVSADSAAFIFAEIAKLGEATMRRIYGDVKGGGLTNWEKAIQAHAIFPQLTAASVAGKNAADIALVIDAMDMLHKGKHDAVCLVSSDSDFTRLAHRLREDGLVVIGFGDGKAPMALRKACTRFVCLDRPSQDLSGTAPAGAAAADRAKGQVPAQASPPKGPGGPTAASPPPRLLPPTKMIPRVREILTQNKRDDGWARLDWVRHHLVRADPEFDAQDFGYQTLEEVLTRSGGFVVEHRDDEGVLIRPRPPALPKQS